MSDDGKPICDRCNEPIADDNHVPLDAVVHSNLEICGDCVKPWDMVVDV